jgi:hypothetical protein
LPRIFNFLFLSPLSFPFHRARCLARLLPLKKISLRGVPHEGRVAPTLYRGAPAGLARARRAATLGVIAFINLRAISTHTSNLERSGAESLGIRFVHIPVGEFSTPSSELADFSLSSLPYPRKLFSSIANLAAIALGSLLRGSGPIACHPAALRKSRRHLRFAR